MAKRHGGTGDSSALDYLSPGRRSWGDILGRWFWRVMIWAFTPIIGSTLVIAGAAEIGPAYAAAHGHGVLGYFVAKRPDTCPQPTTCSWRGNFTAANGLSVRHDVLLDGTWRNVSKGTTIPALDSGDLFAVYPRTGSRHWQEDVEWLAVGTAIMVPWLWFAVGRRLRRARWAQLARRRMARS